MAVPRKRTASPPAMDKDLIEQTLAGNTEAFGGLVRKYQDRLYSAMVNITGCRTEAEDIVQEAFVRAFVALKTFKQNSTFYTWVYRIAVNLAISYLRKKSPSVSLDAGIESTGSEPVDKSSSPMDKMLREERGPLIAAALAKLNDEYRSVLVLREIEQFDYQTIAEILCLKIGTVRSRLHRARTQMRRLLDVAI